MTFRPDVGHIEKDLPRHLPLEAERPSLSVRIPKILLERAVLRIRQTWWARCRRWKLCRPVGIAATRCGRCSIDQDGVGRGSSEVQRQDLRIERLVTDLIAASPHELVIAEKLSEQARGKRRRPGHAKCRAEI